jgi:hypothetical protein
MKNIGENGIMRNLITDNFHQYFNMYIKISGTLRACSTRGRDEKCIQIQENGKEEATWERKNCEVMD